MASYLEKEIVLIEKLKATSYEAFSGSRKKPLGFVKKQFCEDIAAKQW